MKDPIIKKAPDNRKGDWPARHLVNMRDNPDAPDHPDYRGWTLEIEATFGKTARPEIQGSQYCVWFFPGYFCHEYAAVKAALIKRCRKEGVTFVYTFRYIPPMSEGMVGFIKEFNAELMVQRGQPEKETAA